MTKQKTRTYARNRSKSSELFSRKGRERIYDNDGSFFLKLVVFVILSALWLRLKNPVEVGGLVVQAIISLKDWEIPIQSENLVCHDNFHGNSDFVYAGWRDDLMSVFIDNNIHNML